MRNGTTRRRIYAAVAAALGGSLLVATPAQAAPPYTLVTANGATCRAYALVVHGVSLSPCISATAETSDLGWLHPSVRVHEGNTDVRVYWQVDPVDGTVVDTAHPKMDRAGNTTYNALVPAGSDVVLVGNAAGSYETIVCTNNGIHYVVRSWLTDSGVAYGNVQSPQFWLVSPIS